MWRSHTHMLVLRRGSAAASRARALRCLCRLLSPTQTRPQIITCTFMHINNLLSMKILAHKSWYCKRCEFSLSIEELSWSVLIVWFLFVQFPCKWRLGFEVNQENSLLKIKLLWDLHAVVMPLEDIEESKGWVGIAKWMNERRLEVDRWSRFKLWFHRMRYRIYTF